MPFTRQGYSAQSGSVYEHMIALKHPGPEVLREIMTIPCGPSQARYDSNTSDPGQHLSGKSCVVLEWRTRDPRQPL